MLQSDYGSSDESGLECNIRQVSDQVSLQAARAQAQAGGSDEYNQDHDRETSQDDRSHLAPSIQSTRPYSNSGTSLHSMLQFNKSDDEEDLHLLLNEIEDQLRAWLGLERDQEFHDISMHCAVNSTISIRS